jgi:hypothetical protein
MTKLLTAVILSLVLSACGTIQTSKNNDPKILGPYNVEGNGSTFDEAKNDAFRKAIEQAVGVAVLSERESKNKEQLKQYVLTHSSGYVERYLVLDKNISSSKPARHRLLVKVYVRTGTMVNDYVLYRSESTKNIDGERADTNIKTHKIAAQTSNDMLLAILKDFPEKSFDVEVFPVEIGTDENGKAVVQISYDIKYSSKFLKSLSNMLAQLTDADCTMLCNKHVFKISYFDKPNNFTITNRNFSFQDESNINLIRRALYQARGDLRFIVKIDYKDSSGNILMTGCAIPNNAKKPSDYRWVNGLSTWRRSWYNPVELNYFSYTLESGSSFISRLSTVDVAAVPVEKCKGTFFYG